MANRSVSNKAVVKDSGFLAKLGSTMARRGPNPMEQGPVRSQIAWKKTSNVKYRLKTLTGTIPIYEDMTEEQVEDVKRKHGLLPGTFPECIPPPPEGEEGQLSPSQMEDADYEVMEANSSTFMSTSSTKVQKRSSTTSITQFQQETSSSSHHQQEEHMESYSSSSRTRKKVSSSSKATEHLASTCKEARVSYVANEEYTPDDYDGLPLTPGQKVFLLSKGSSHKKARLEGGSEDMSTGEAPQLLDNSLAKSKAAIRPKKNHPDSRSRPGSALFTSPEPQQQPQESTTTGEEEERWFVQDFDTGREGYVPARALGVSKQASVVSSIKSSVANLSGEEANQMKLQMLEQIRAFRSKRPSRTLGPTPEDEARAKRTATIQELIETEEEFCRDLKFAMAKYYRLMEDPNTPYHIREHKDIIFNNFKSIADFHENVLIEGVKYNAEVPLLIGKTFLRLERDFDKHAEYCSNEPLAQDFVDNNPIIRDYFEDYSNKIGDEKRLSEHLKLPIQRLNDYQLLLRELVKFSHKLGDNTEDLQRAFELMQTIPQRATDAKFISSIEGFKGNLFKLGRLVRHDWFSVSESGGKPRDRYLFLFKARVLITKVKRISEDRSIFVLKDIIRLPETNINEVDNAKAISFNHIEPQTHLNFPLTIEARNADIREAWYDGVKEFVVDTASVEDLLFDDELRVISADVDEEDPHAIASPVPEIQEYEDLPEDSPHRSPAKVSPKAGREPSPPAKRVKAEQQQSQRATGTPVQVEVETGAESVVDAPIGKTPTPQCPTPTDKDFDALLECGSPTPFYVHHDEEFDPYPGFADEDEAHDRLKTEDSSTRKISTGSSGSGTEAAFERIATDAQAELDEKARREEEARLAVEVREKEEAETRAKAEAEAEACRQRIASEASQAREEEDKRAREEVRKAREEQERRSREEAEKKEREEAEKYAREESERIARAETERKSREETDRKTREEEERRTREETERKSRQEAERQAREEEERRAREESERLAREAEERRVREETERREREEADRNSREEERRTREDAEKKAREESQRQAREEDRRASEENERIAREAEEKRVREEKEKKEREEAEIRAKEEAQRQTREEEARRAREEADKKAREESERQTREVEERRAREEKERIAKEAEEKRVREVKEIKEKEEAERRAREDVERKSREETERKTREEEERRNKEETERKIKDEADKKVREEAERKSREEAERIAREGAERKTREEADRKAKEEAERKAKEETERKAKEEAERKTREEAEIKVKKEAEANRKIEENRRAKEEEAKKLKEEEVRKAKEEESKRLKEEEARKTKEKAEAEAKTKSEAEAKAKAEAKSKADAEAKSLKEEQAAKAKVEAEAKSKAEAEAKTKAEAKSKADTEAKRLKEEQAAKAKAEVEAKSKAEAEAKTKAEAKSKADAEAKRLKEEQAAKAKAEVEAKSKAEAQVKKQKEEQEAKARKEAEAKAKAEAASASQKQAVSQQKPASPKVVVPAQQKSNMSEPQTPDTGYGLQKTPGTASGAPRPIFTTQLKGECVEPGEGVKFVCEIGHPVPYFVTWLKDSKPLDDKLADRVQQVDDGITHSLKILNCRKQDSGTYTAKAADEVGGAATSSAQLLVQELTEEERAARIAEKTPFFMVKMKDTHVIENTNLSYCVNVRGNPPPEVIFYKDGDELMEDSRIAIVRNKDQGHYELVFAYVTQSDGGKYKAVAKNNFGKAECDANMVVTEEEVAYQKLAGKGSLMEEGEKADFKWFRDGQEYDPLERFNVMFRGEEDTLALVFQNVTPEDAGLYTCVASTSGGKISCSAELTVEGAVNRLLRDPEPPCIIEELVDVMVAINGSAMLECKVTGFPKPELKWSRNCLDVKIGGRFKQICEDDDTVTLIIKNIEEFDGGHYRIMAVNELGDAESTCSLKIKSAPKIKKMKKDAACKLGINLEHTAEITGEPKPNLKWLKDGKSLYETERVKGMWLEDGLFCLSIGDMDKDDCATYTLVAENDMGVVQESFELEVDSPPEIQRGLEAEMDRKAGGDFTLEVRCKGSPRPMARWFFNGKELDSDSEKYVMKRDETFYQLKIKGLDRKDKGTFKCVLCNSSGEAESEGKLNVRAPPDFTTPLRDAACKEGTVNEKLFVQVVSVPAATFKWFFGDKAIDNETPGYTLKSTDETNSLLCVKEALPEFCGVYTCKASNEVGESKTTCKFRLYEAPVITEPLQDLEMLEDMDYKWGFRCTGVPVPDIKWTKDGKKFSPDERRVKAKKDGDEIYRLEFMEAKVEDKAVYEATLTNAVATVTTSAKLATNTPPHVKDCNFKEGKSFYAGHKFLLSIECHSEPICDAFWYWGEKELNEQEDNCKMWYDEEKHTFFLERYATDTDHAGMYKVLLKNKIGQHEQQANIKVTEKEARVRVALEDCCVHENGTAVMKCQIVGDPLCEVTWLKDGKKLPTTERIQTEEDRMAGWQTITVKEVTERDNCIFTCKGVNKHGQCKTEARLGVLVAPQPTELKDAKVDYGKDLTICVSIHAFPVPQMKWFLEGNELPTDQPEKYSYNYEDGVKELHSITVHNCVLEDAGYYKFVASNEAGQASKKQETKVHTEKPSVVIGLKEEKVCLEDEVTMKVQLAGLPLPDVTWLNKEKPVSTNPRYIIERPDNADFFHLTIKDVCMEDYGHITAVGKSLVGECHTVAEMAQKKLPCTFVQGLENVTKGAEGDDVTLTVKIKASPRPTFQWFKDGDVLEESEKVMFSMTKTTYCEATITVTLVEASSLESGQYKLKITNEVNDASTETALICRPVRRAPKITKKPENASCQENEKAMFKCKINGFPKPDVKWMKDGRPLSFTETTDSGMTAEGFYYFEFKSVTSEDAGNYTVIASNDEGKTSAECKLEVIPPPSKPDFLMGLKPGKVIQGYPGRFEVKCGGYPPPTITWMKDGVPLEIDGKHLRQVVLEDGTVQLLIDNCTEADQGKYTCLAQSSEGQIESTADLSVLGFQRKDGQPEGPAKFSEGLRDSCFDEGKTIKLSVAMKGGPVPIMKWYKDGEEIILGDGVFFTYDGDRNVAFIEITPAKGSDSGIYKCVIQNDAGKDETECEVTIRKCYEAPSFGSCFGSVCQLPGREAKFPVHFDGVPKPEFEWFKDGQPIVIDGDKYRIKKDGDCYTLIVADCTYGDSGVIKVVLKNREGEIEHEGTLEVGDNVDPNRKSEAPNFLKTIGDQELYEGYIAKFKAVVVGSPFPDFEFSKDGARVYSTNRIVVERDQDGEGLIRLTIKQVRPEDAGQYTLRCWNEHGEKSCSGKLICESLTSKKKRPVGDEYEGFPKIRRSGVPMPLPDKPYISALSERRVTLSWMPYLPQGPTMPVTYQIEMSEVPEGEYFTVRSGIRGCKCDILNLNPKLDYRFRVRVENKFGVSEASPYVQTYRYKLDQEPTSYEPSCDPNYVYKGEGPYVPEGFRIERTHEGNYFAAPRFLKLPHETQYGIKGFNSRVKWYAFGWPTPKLQFLFNEEPLKTGASTRFTVSQEASGEIILFVDKMTAADVGWYSCIVKNEHGQSCQRIKLQMAEFPKVTEHLEEMYLRTNTNGKLMVRIQASPLCEVTWFKDWEPLTTSYRFRPQFCADDMYILHINGASLRDTGFYSVAATNAAGTVMSSCFVHVEEEDLSFNWAATGRGKQVIVNQRRGTLEDTYDVGDELGRGTQGVTYHCVERYTGRNFAAKSMWGRDKLKVWMHMEFEMMNLVNNSQYICRLFDAYEGPKNMVLVQELCSGGDLLHHLTQQQFITEYEVAHYIRQVLLGLEYMHDRCLAHCGLNVGDILLTRPNGKDIKLCDLSLARHIRSGKLQPLDYGMPEFVAPEVANGENISYGVDMWSVGIISYLLLSGTSPFRGDHDRETLSRIQKGDMSFDMEAFTHISNEAKDFIARLLKFEPDLRLDVKGALMHPWIAFSQIAVPRDVYKINTDRLRTYYVKYRDWYANASCKRWFRRRTLSSAFTHPSKMVYPPGEVYTPPDSPEREILPVKDDGWLFEERDLSYQIDVITNDSQYQSGPDTFLMQLRDVDFPVRLRQYMKVAEERSPAFNMYMRENQYDYSRVPMVHERRRFIDVMDEEPAVEDRRRTMLDKYTAGFVRTQMTQEICSLDMPKIANQPGNQLAIGDAPAGSGTVPFIREKPQSVSVASGEPIAFTCIASGEPQPTIQWFKDDMILGVTTRCTISTKEDGRSTLTIERPNEFDTGLYKVIARNPSGQSSHKFRVMSGDIPGPCEPPEVSQVSATECLVRWRPPRDGGNSPIVHYHLQIKPAGETEYVTFRDNIDHEFYLVKDLAPNSIYQFKVAAKNAFGWGQFSVATAAIRTGQQGVSQIELSHSMQFQMELTESGINDKMKKLNAKSSRELDYNKEREPIKMKSGDAAELQLSKYNFVSEMSRGRFSVVAKCVRRDDQRQFAAKIMQRTGREEAVKQEYEVLKALRHERIAQLCEAYTLGNVTILLQEQLSGHDILTYLSNLYEYSEQTIVTVVLQLIDALQYLHWKGYCHLDLQPDNIVVVSPRNCHIKLVDLGSTREVPASGATVPVNGLLEYIAPEILSEQKAYPVSDVWSLGTLTYTLLTGRSAFKGDDVEETNENIQYVRYRCDYLHCSQEAVRFVMLILKRDPSKRPSLEDLREHRWMLENEFMAKKRDRAMLSGTRLRDHDEKYHKERTANGTTLKELLSFGGLNLPKKAKYEQMLYTQIF